MFMDLAHMQRIGSRCFEKASGYFPVVKGSALRNAVAIFLNAGK